MKRYLTIAAGCLFLMGAARIGLATDPNPPQSQSGQSQVQADQQSQSGQQSQMGQPPQSSQQSQSSQQPQSGQPSQASQQSNQGQSSAASSSSSTAQPMVALGEVVPLEGKVTRIDKQNRTVTIQGSQGRSVTFKADPQARQFDQLNVGDQIRGRFYQGVVIGIGQSNTNAPVEGTESVTVQSARGQQPSEMRWATLTMQAKVDSVDPAKHTVTLTGPEGRTENFTVSPNVNLDQLKPGQTLNVRYTLGVALELERQQQQQQQQQ